MWSFTQKGLCKAPRGLIHMCIFIFFPTDIGVHNEASIEEVPQPPHRWSFAKSLYRGSFVHTCIHTYIHKCMQISILFLTDTGSISKSHHMNGFIKPLNRWDIAKPQGPCETPIKRELYAALKGFMPACIHTYMDFGLFFLQILGVIHEALIGGASQGKTCSYSAHATAAINFFSIIYVILAVF